MENSNSVPCKLKVPKNVNNKTPPYLVTFSNGNVNPNYSDKLNFITFQRKNDNNISSEVKRILIAKSSRLTYESSISDNIDKNKMRYYIGVRNKASGKMKVYDSLSFHLRPSKQTNLLSSSNTEERNFKERIDDLTVSFGSKIRKRTMSAQQKYSVDREPLDHALKDMHLEEPSTDQSASLNMSSSIEYIPPQNYSAKSVDEVYNINDIISTEEDAYLDNKAKLLLQDLPTHLTQWKNDNAYSEYVLEHLGSLVDNVKAKYLIYYNYLVMFSKLVASDIKKKDPAPDIPEPIKTNLLDHFTVSSVLETGKHIRSFTKLMKDKLLAYMLVLALFIDDYNVDLTLVQKGTKYGLNKTTNIAQVLGCHVTKQKIGNSSIPFAKLKLPLFVSQKYYKKF